MAWGSPMSMSMMCSGNVGGGEIRILIVAGASFGLVGQMTGFLPAVLDQSRNEDRVGACGIAG